MFSKLRSALQTDTDMMIHEIQVPLDPSQDPKSCTEWTTLDVPDDIIAALQQRNTIHFYQAQGTPFTIPPLSDSLHYTAAKGPHTMSILQGSYDASSCNDSTKQILTKISELHARSLDHPQLPSHITLSEMKAKLQVWPEATTTSPSGLHLGHYKALIKKLTPPLDSDKSTQDFYKEIKDKQQCMFEAHHKLVNYALQRGFSYHRWQTTSSLILRKDINDFRIHRHHVIHLFEADYNLFLTTKWRQLLLRAEMLSLLNAGQFGSRPHCNAHDPFFLEVFQRQLSMTT